MNKSQIVEPGDSPNFNIKDFIDLDDKFDLNNSLSEINKEDASSQICTGITNSKISRKVVLASPNDSFNQADTKLNSKHKALLSNISNSVASFVSDFNFLFYDQLFQKFYKEISGLAEEKFRKSHEISKGFLNQIMEMEIMMQENDAHSESLKIIIDDLKSSRDEEIAKNNEHYSMLIEAKRSQFNSANLLNSPSLETIKEKFKIDMLNTVNDIIYPRK